MRRLNLSIIFLICFLLLALSGVLLYYENFKLPQVADRREALVRQELDESAMPKEGVWVVTGDGGILPYTEITRELAEANLTYVEIPVKYLVEKPVRQLESVLGMVTKEQLYQGQQLVTGQFYTAEDWYGPEDRLKEYPVVSLVAEEVQVGNLIDVLVHYGNGDYDVVVAKKKVRKIVRPSAQEGVYSQTNSHPSEQKGYTIILAVDENQYRDLTLAAQLGELETRLYLDADQAPSLTSFDYEGSLKGLPPAPVNPKPTIAPAEPDEIIYIQENP